MSLRPSVDLGESLRPDIANGLEQFDLQADQEGFVGLKIAPALEVATQAGTYGVLELADSLREVPDERNSDGSYNMTGRKFGKDSYKTEEHGIAERVDDRDAAIYGAWFDAERLAAEGSRDVVLRNHNRRVIEAATGISNTTSMTVTTDGQAGVAWSDVDNAKPITDLRVIREKVRMRCGVRPNALCLEEEIYEILRDNTQVIERVKYFGGQDPNHTAINEQALARAFGLSEIIVASSITNTAKQGKAAALETQWPRTKALLFHKAKSSDLKRPQFMRTIHWGQDGSRIGGVFDSWRSPEDRSWKVRNRMETQEKVVYDAVAEILDNIAA